MKVDAWMPLYVRDFLVATEHLNPDECSAYLRLLMHMWERGGSLKNDDVALRKLAGGFSAHRWPRVWEAICDFFTLDGDVLTQKRLMYELTKSQKFRRSQSERGKKGAALRWADDGMAEALPNDGQKMASSPSPSPSPSETDPERDPPIVPRRVAAEYSAEFLELWAMYPRKVGKGAAHASWQKSHVPPGLLRAALAWQVKSPDWVKDGGQFIPHLATWLNQRRWEDEPTKPKPSGSIAPALSALDAYCDLHRTPGSDDRESPQPRRTCPVCQKRQAP